MALWVEEEYGSIADRVCWALWAISCFVVVLRLICRGFFAQGRLGRLGLDDYITVVCIIVNFVTCIFMQIGSSYGLGKHMSTLTESQVVNSIKWNVYISSILIWTFSLPKFAIVAILKRILDYGPKTAVVFWSLAISCQLAILATSFWWFLQCKPVAYQWDRSIPGGWCASVGVMSNLGYATSAYSAFLDLFFAFYPIPFVMKLNMPLRNRIAVACALSLSSLAFIVSIYKLAIFRSVFKELAKDLTYPVPYLDILGVAEGSILLICASLPTLGPLFRVCKSKLTSLRSNTTGVTRSADHHGQNGGTIVTIGQLSNVRGFKLGDPESISTTGIHSVDDIPLVTVSSRTSQCLHEQSVHQSKEDMSIKGNKPAGF